MGCAGTVRGPLAAFAADFWEQLIGDGYSMRSAEAHLLLMARLSRWLDLRGVRPAEFEDAGADEFIAWNRGVAGAVPEIAQRHGAAGRVPPLPGRDSASGGLRVGTPARCCWNGSGRICGASEG